MSDADFRKTSFADIHKGAECREYKVRVQRVEYPSSIVWHFTCPWCSSDTKAYLWSLSGGGKRCECGAIFGARGVGYKLAAASAANAAPAPAPEPEKPATATELPPAEKVADGADRV